MSEATPQQTIREWSVTANGRLVGAVFNRPGQADGRTILTSRVVEVRLLGEPASPVAFTESGTAYWLGDPSAQFGLDQAETFVWRMSRAEPAAPEDGPDPMGQTMFLLK